MSRGKRCLVLKIQIFFADLGVERLLISAYVTRCDFTASMKSHRKVVSTESLRVSAVMWRG